MLISIVDELNQCEKNFGELSENQTKKIITFAQAMDFDCLSFITTDLDTIFNNKQMKTLIGEIKLAKQKGIIDRNTFNALNKAIEYGLKYDYVYIRFYHIVKTLGAEFQIMLKQMVDLPTRDNILPKYQIILTKINAILESIAHCDRIECAEQYFDQLLEIHDVLSILVYRVKIDENERINKFVSTFDRVNDSRAREYLFNEIQANDLKY